jgi:GNAT superfamily N-acetyltransferase
LTARFRRAVAGDAALIHQLLGDMAAEDGGHILGSVESLLHNGFGPQPRFHVVLAMDAADAALGLAIYFAEYSTWRGTLGLYVQDIYLAPTARGRGLGRAILAAALRDADWPVGFVTLMVSRKNAAARAFYDRLGFTQRDITDPLILTGAGLAALCAP